MVLHTAATSTDLYHQTMGRLKVATLGQVGQSRRSDLPTSLAPYPWSPIVLRRAQKGLQRPFSLRVTILSGGLRAAGALASPRTGANPRATFRTHTARRCG